MRRVSLALGALALLVLAPSVARAFDDSSPFSPPRQALGQATELIVQGRFAEAEPCIKQALQMDPRLAEAHYNLGVVYRATGRPELAVAEYQDALNRFAPGDRPNRAKSLYGIALATEELRDPARSARAWADYIRFDEDSPSAAPAVSIARARLSNMENELALRRPVVPGTQKAGR